MLSTILFYALFLFILIFGFFFLSMAWGMLRFGIPSIHSGGERIETMVALGKLEPGMVVFDLGCGDGRVVCQASKVQEVRAIGIEGVWGMAWWARMRAKLLGYQVEIRHENFFKTDLSEADVIFCYLFTPIMQRLYDEKWSTLKKGCRIVSHAFEIPGLEPVVTQKIGKGVVRVYETQ